MKVEACRHLFWCSLLIYGSPPLQKVKVRAAQENTLKAAKLSETAFEAQAAFVTSGLREEA